MGDSDTSVTSQASSGSGSSGKNSLSSYLPPSAATKSSGRNSGAKARKLSSSLKVSFWMMGLKYALMSVAFIRRKSRVLANAEPLGRLKFGRC